MTALVAHIYIQAMCIDYQNAKAAFANIKFKRRVIISGMAIKSYTLESH
jgi:hypothetical protein